MDADQIQQAQTELKKDMESAIFPKASKLKGRKLEPKYRDPETGKTWAGRGRLPSWLVGKDKEAFKMDEFERRTEHAVSKALPVLKAEIDADIVATMK